jgi:hypothetical protein
MNSNTVVFNKSHNVVFRDTTGVVFRKNLGIKEIKGSEKRKFITELSACAPGLAFSQV